MNKVDQHIKLMMLTYPTLFKSRMAALKQLFMTNGNGYEWDDKGCLCVLFREPALYLQEMDFSDLDERQQELDKEIAESKESSALARLYASRAAALKREYAERRLIASDIDLYAVEHVMGEDIKYGVEWMKHFDPRWCVMLDAPFDNLDPEWAAAAEETMVVARDAIWRHLFMYHENFDRAKADAQLLRIYDQLVEIIDKLDATTGTKKKNARSAELAKELLKELSR